MKTKPKLFASLCLSMAFWLPTSTVPAFADSTLPVPSNLMVDGTTSDTVYLSWADTYGPTGYDVFENGDPTPILTNVQSKTLVPVTDLSANTTYTFTVAAIDADGDLSTPSNPVTALTVLQPPRICATLDGSGGILVNLYPSASFQPMNLYVDGELVNSTPTEQSTFDLNNLTLGQTYSITATTVVDGVESKPSDPYQITILSKPTLAATVGSHTATISWKPVPGAVSYNLYSNATNFERVNTTPITGTSYTLTNLQNGEDITYYLSPVDKLGVELSGMTTPGITVTPYDPTPPGAPTNLRVLSENQGVKLTWTPPASNGEWEGFSYDIYVNGELYTSNIGDSCDVSDLVNGTSYKFSVVAHNNFKQISPMSSTVVGTPVEVPTRVSVSPDLNALTVSWNKPTEKDIIGFNVYNRNTGEKLNTALIKGYSFTATGLKNDTMYYFGVTAVTKNGDESSPGTYGGLTQFPIPSEPKNLTAKYINNEIQLSWTPSNAADTYNIFENNSMELSDQSSGTTFTVDQVAPGQTYQFYVEGNNAAGTSAQSLPVSITVPTAEDTFTDANKLYAKGNDYNALVTAVQAIHEGYQGKDASSFVQKAAKGLYGQAYADYTHGNYSSAENDDLLLLDTPLVPSVYQKDAKSNVSVLNAIRANQSFHSGNYYGTVYYSDRSIRYGSTRQMINLINVASKDLDHAALTLVHKSSKSAIADYTLLSKTENVPLQYKKDAAYHIKQLK